MGNIKNVTVTAMGECLEALPSTVSLIILPMWSLCLQQPGSFTSQSSRQTAGMDGHHKTSQHHRGHQVCPCVTKSG